MISERDIITHEVIVDGEPVYARMHKSVELTDQVIADIRAVTRKRRSTAHMLMSDVDPNALRVCTMRSAEIGNR